MNNCMVTRQRTVMNNPATGYLSFAFIHLSKITLSTTVRALKPVQQYGQLKTVTMEMKKLYLMLTCPALTPSFYSINGVKW